MQGAAGRRAQARTKVGMENPANPTPDRGTLRRLAGVALRTKPLRRTVVALVHMALWALAFTVALQIRFDGGQVPAGLAGRLQAGLAVLIVLRLGSFVSLGLFDGLWRYAGVSELKNIVVATASTSGLILLGQIAAGQVLVPRGVLLGELIASVVLVGGARLIIRATYESGKARESGTPTLILGAGDAGESLLRDVLRMRDGLRWRVVGFLDDDPAKHGLLVHGVPVLGSADAETLRRVVRQHAVELVVLAWPTAAGARTREVVRQCRTMGVAARTVPGLAERLGGGPVPPVRELDIADLLHRDPVTLDLKQVRGLLEGKVVLVSGAGGSIGSELCRQALKFAPQALLLLDHDENALFYIERELQELARKVALVPLVADITDAARMDRVLRRHHPAVVLHAAAHKHVGMMEANPAEAARNNVLGTRTLAEAAHAAKCEAFILVSTDKAVNPTSVMGATKRACELVVQGLAARSATRFAAVRFGNVLGSAGSVVPIFREQIARGGPVTVTHPDVTRYFMTIPEAAQLVLQAAALTRSGEIFLLDMGEPVKILDLARDLIELSGLKPGEDIEIEFTGLKPAEKLAEELLLGGEGYDRTSHPMVMVGRIQAVNQAELERGLARLQQAASESDDSATRRALGQLVPEARLVVPPTDLLDVMGERAEERKAARSALRRETSRGATPLGVPRVPRGEGS